MSSLTKLYCSVMYSASLAVGCSLEKILVFDRPPIA
jgi:hypothetical protein